MRDSPGISKNAALALAECGVTSDTRIDCAARASPPAGVRIRRHSVAGVRGQTRSSWDPREAVLRGGK